MTVMNRVQLTGVLAVLMALVVSSPAFPHHSHAMYDHTKETSVKGKVSEFVFRNPHVFLYVESKTDSGETVKYTIEMSNITNMIRVGVGVNTFKPGDEVTVQVHPLRDGRPGGNYITAVGADGKAYGRV
jgi:hypothetical protein